ncbi:hypothetical protein N7456_006249 [Penicillium angulare]|uniref:Rhodopsin domain-containing protein n=1 Tax=Penicillium angulare TaxID=116970 RepID=A0A9W9FHB2_9EURO|nr:hypothetical protein N7456_006249 [Penicillium angulare]
MNWDVTVQGTCGSEKGTYLSLQIINLIFDVAVGLCPIPVLWSLQLKLARKIELSCLFSLGIIYTASHVHDIGDSPWCHFGLFAIATPCYGEILDTWQCQEHYPAHSRRFKLYKT